MVSGEEKRHRCSGRSFCRSHSTRILRSLGGTDLRRASYFTSTTAMAGRIGISSQFVRLLGDVGTRSLTVQFTALQVLLRLLAPMKSI